MKKVAFAICFLFIFVISVFSVPVNNPLSEYYGNGNYPVWTDSVNWSNYIDMSSYSNGSNDYEKFENARDELYNQGGGVLFYPEGDYYFYDMPASGKNGKGLMLKTGVFIRGESPAMLERNALDTSLSPKTVFHFPIQKKPGVSLDSGIIPQDWNLIGLMPSGGEELKDVKNVGICWINTKYAAVYFGFQINFGSTYSTAGAWKSSKVKADWADRVPDGTHPLDIFCGYNGNSPDYIGSGSGRLVFGCKFDHSTVLNDAIDEGFGSDGYYMYKFGARIGIYGKNVFVANNFMPVSDKNFTYNQITNSSTEKIIIFDYGKTFGLDINKAFLNPLNGKINGYLNENVVVRDNYVFNHGTKGFELSGEFIIVRDNKNDREYLDEGSGIYGFTENWELTLDGYKESEPGGSGSVSDNLSRAFDMAGAYGWIDSNWYSATGSDPGNDGEGILWQAHGGMASIRSFAITNNTHVTDGGEAGYMAGYDVSHYGSLIIWNKTPGWIGNTKAGDNISSAFLDPDNTVYGGIQTTGTDVITTCPVSNPDAPLNVKATEKEGYVEITWEDNSTDEIGFRIDKKVVGGNWQTVCYQPRESGLSAYNEMIWKDFMPVTNIDSKYRVVAINCDDSDLAAEESEIVSYKSVQTFSQNTRKDKLLIYPNPFVSKLNIESGKEIKNIVVYNCLGNIVYEGNGQNNQINLSGLNEGIYFIKINSGKIRKVIKGKF